MVPTHRRWFEYWPRSADKPKSERLRGKVKSKRVDLASRVSRLAATMASFILKIGNPIMKNGKHTMKECVVFDPCSGYLPCACCPPRRTKERASRNRTRKASLSGLPSTANGPFWLRHELQSPRPVPTKCSPMSLCDAGRGTNFRTSGKWPEKCMFMIDERVRQAELPSTGRATIRPIRWGCPS
jgi:hypothetical protein